LYVCGGGGLFETPDRAASVNYFTASLTLYLCLFSHMPSVT